LRSVKYRIEKSKSGKTASLLAIIEDRFGRNRINLSRVRGWRKELALKYLTLNQEEWNDNVAKAFVCIEVLKCARNQDEAVKFLQAVNSLDQLELHFWATKLLNGNKKAIKAWRILYG